MTNDPAEMSIADYVASGGVMTSPANVPPRYRAELLRLMATFVDSMLAGAAGFADIINEGPGIKERIAAARIVLEKTDHADRVLSVMAEFGVDRARYASHHPWTARLDRDADIGATRSAHDMRLAVFNYPLTGWTDAVVMNLLMGTAVGIQLDEMRHLPYQPLADALRQIAPREAHHTALAEEGLATLQAEAETVRASIGYWWPRVAVSFGSDSSSRSATLRKLGLRRTDNAALRARWESAAAAALDRAGFTRP